MHRNSKRGGAAVAARTFAFVAGLMLCVPTQAAAQPEHADSILHRNNCRLAEQVLLAGHPANRRGWALDYIVTCGAQGGQVLGMLFQRQRAQVTRSAALDAIAEAAVGFVDRSLALAATDIAADVNAGRAARVHAFRVVYSQVLPEALVTYERITRSEVVDTRPLSSGATAVQIEPIEADWVLDRGTVRGEPLQPSDLAAIQARLTAVAEDSAESAGIREAARNTVGAIRAHLRRLSLCPVGTPAPVCLERLKATTRE